LVTALGGHFVANLIFDEEQYAASAPELIRHLQDPFAIQAGLIVLAVIGLSRRAGRRPPPPRSDVAEGRYFAWLAGAQLVLFVALEASERIAVDALWDVPNAVEPFGEGFVEELVVALASAAILAAIGRATIKILPVTRGAEGATIPETWLRIHASISHRAASSSGPSMRGPPIAYSG
jgi:hypothetical protein